MLNGQLCSDQGKASVGKRQLSDCLGKDGRVSTLAIQSPNQTADMADERQTRWLEAPCGMLVGSDERWRGSMSTELGEIPIRACS